MERVPKNNGETRQNILAAAEAEFLEHGFEKAALRTICRKAGVTTGALYFFFDNKNALFRELVEKTSTEFWEFNLAAAREELEHGKNIVEQQGILDGELDRKNERQMMSYLFRHRSKFLLLMTKAKGSDFEDFPQRVKALMQDSFEASIRIYMKKTMTQAQIKYSAKLLTSWRINSYMELLQSDMPLPEMLEYTDMISRYAVGGWNEIMK